MKLPPPGAIPEEVRQQLRKKSRDTGSYGIGYYAVDNESGHLGIGGRIDPNYDESRPVEYSLGWLPIEAYYFTNYWYALAYSMQIKSKKKRK